VLSDAGMWPNITRPGSADGGCFSIHYAVGGQIRRVTFDGDVATRSGESPVFSAAGLSALSAEREAAAPALMWSAGSDVYFGLAAAGPAPAAAVVPAVLPADGTSTAAVTASGFADVCGRPLPSGALANVQTSAGGIVEPDVDPGTGGIQLALTAPGSLSFRVRASLSSAIARVTVVPAAGGPGAIGSLTFAAADAGAADSGIPDAGSNDSGVSDSGVSDSGVSDSGVSDSGVSDSGVSDSGVSDSGVPDAGGADGGSSFGDGGFNSTDGGAADGGTVNRDVAIDLGCGCASGFPGGSAAMLLLALVRRRRR